MVRMTSLFVSLIFLVSQARADILFEGYSKITSGGVHAGYVVTRYEFNPKTKQFVSTYFLRTGALGSDVTESLKAVADEDLKPVSYEYTSMIGKTVKTIDAKFKGSKMTAAVTEDGKTKTVSKDLPKGAFLSTFLVYLMLKSKSGLRTDEKYEYQAVAEEDADVVKGEAFVGKEETRKGLRAFKVLNRFKDIKFVSYVNERGEVLSTDSQSTGIATELVARPADAVGAFGTSPSIMKKLFGETPQGTNNIVSKAGLEQALTPPPEPGSDKKQGMPAGSGLLNKTKGSDQ